MRARWEALHSSLSAVARSLKFNLSFLKAKQHHPLLTDFSDPGRVIAFFHSKSGDLDAKDQLLAFLVSLAQRGEHRELATTLLWLGLWPGLDGVYRRRLKHFGAKPDELVSELAGAFIDLIERLNLANVERVAATLVRSTERDVMDGLKRQWADARRPEQDPTDVGHFVTTVDGAAFGLIPANCGKDEAADLRAWLRPIVGDDTELLIAVLVHQESQREAGARLGLSHEAARKRFQRALGRVRTHLKRTLSHDEPLARV